jgi:hypothetical protein
VSDEQPAGPDYLARPEARPKPPSDVPPVSAERLVENNVAMGPDAGPRRYPSTVGGAFYLLVLAITLASLLVVALGSWRDGVTYLAGGLCFAAVVRLLLPTKDAGMLAVRSKWLDALLLCGVGVALAVLAHTIPNQPGT